MERSLKVVELAHYADDSYSEALARSPQQIDALQGRANSLISTGKQEKAEADLALAKEIHDRF